MKVCFISKTTSKESYFTMNKSLIFFLFLISCQSPQPMDINEWIDVKRFAKGNNAIKESKLESKLVVYMGDSITEGWDRFKPGYFKNPNLVNRGISGHTSHQMLMRFRQDVLLLEPSMVIINCGTNDIAGNAGTYNLDQTMDNIKSMIDLAIANNIEVILSSVLPADSFGLMDDHNPSREIIEINEKIKELANQKGLIYLDYHTAMKDDNNGLNSVYTYDGVHPNAAGYTVIEQVIQMSTKN